MNQWNYTVLKVFALCLGIASILSFVLRYGHQNYSNGFVQAAIRPPMYLDARKRPVCSQGAFQQFYSDYDSYPKGGFWNDTDIPHFEPDFCQFELARITPSYLKTCMQRLRMRYIVTVGDSQGMKYFSGMLQYFQAAYDSCTQLKSESLVDGHLPPSTEYFSRGNKTIQDALKVENRRCRTCLSQEWKCTNQGRKNGQDVTLEHLGMAHVKDKTIHIKDDTIMSISNYQEFILSFYLGDRPPDVLIFFIPFNHDKRLTVKRFYNEMLKFKSNIAKYIPPETRVYFMTGTTEFEQFKKKEFVNALFHRKLGTDQIATQNAAMFKALKDELLATPPALYGFFDLQELSSSRERWSHGGVHFYTVWYEAVMSYLLQAICN